MAKRLPTFLMLFLVSACPAVCGASLSATPRPLRGTNQSSNTPTDPCCPSDERRPATPDEPCQNTTCFCSPFVMHETGSNPVFALALAASPALAVDDALFSLGCFLPNRESWEHPVFSPGMADTAAALPLLI